MDFEQECECAYCRADIYCWQSYHIDMQPYKSMIKFKLGMLENEFKRVLTESSTNIDYKILDAKISTIKTVLKILDD